MMQVQANPPLYLHDQLLNSLVNPSLQTVKTRLCPLNTSNTLIDYLVQIGLGEV